MTAIFVCVILAVTDARNEHPALAPLAIGLALAMIHFASIRHRHLGQPGPLDRRRRCSPAPTRSSSSGCSSSAPLLGARDRRPRLPAALRPRRPTPVPGSGLQLRAGRAGRAVPGYGAPDQYQQEWNQPQAAQARPLGAGADHPGRLAVGPRRPRSGSRSSSGRRRHRRPSRSPSPADHAGRAGQSGPAPARQRSAAQQPPPHQGRSRRRRHGRRPRSARRS